MNALAEAWEWHRATRQSLEQMRRIGRKYWNEIPWDKAAIGRDDDLKMLDAPEIERATSLSLARIDDLAVVVLFSTFESLVRDYLVKRVAPEAASLADPILKHAAGDAMHGLMEGSFYRRILQPLKEQERIAAELVTQVDQVRDYRNWVAHGSRNIPRNLVTPRMAYDRLRKFLDALGIDVEPE